jgi:hypothetical protein
MLNFLPLKLKFGVFVISVSLFSGCAGPLRPQFTADQLIKFRVDCSKKSEQIAFLESIKPTSSEERDARSIANSLGQNNPKYDTYRMIADGTTGTLINDKIILLEEKCRK